MDAKINMNWPIEEIPNEHFLFTRIFKGHLSKQDNLPKADAFKNTPYGVDSNVLSSDWEKYISAKECRDFVKNFVNKKTGIPKEPDDYFIWKMNVGKIRTELIPSQEVTHTPREYNRAHASIEGKKPENEGVNNAEFRSLIIEIGDWEIAP